MPNRGLYDARQGVGGYETAGVVVGEKEEEAARPGVGAEWRGEEMI